ncbi:MAG: hypothetical protein HKO02_13280 [Hyphomonadaceae bacterium]|nr:hypothetical protein [Hyphomonadaceae bacterium]
MRTFNNPERSLIMFSLTLCLTFGGCTQDVPSPNDSTINTDVVRMGDDIVATIDGTNIYQSDVQNAALAKGLIDPETSITPQDPVFRRQLDELIDRRLLALEALRLSLDQNDETRRRLAASRELILSNIVVENLLKEKVTDESLKRMYDEQSALRTDMKQVRARHILVDSAEKAKEVYDLLANGGDFSTLAKQISIDNSTRDLGGDLSYFTKASMDAEIADTAFALKKGEISKPFKTDRGWHVLEVVAMRATPQPAFADIKPEIKSFMTYDEIGKKLKSLRSESQIDLNFEEEMPETQDGP